MVSVYSKSIIIMNNIVWSTKVDEILSKGISLEPIGVKNWALSRQDALEALNQFLILQIPVLGGDVCELTKGNPEYNYDNWYCDRIPGESDLAFVNRSINKAKDYIISYNMEYRDKIFFALVPEV